MGRSDSSDSERDRRSKKSKKKGKYRSRSRSSSSDRSRKSKHKSSRKNSRSRSRERKRSRSRSRDRHRGRSRSLSRDRTYKRKDKSRSRSRNRGSSRSRGQDRKHYSSRYSSDDSESVSKSSGRYVKASSEKSGWHGTSSERPGWDVRYDKNDRAENISLKDKVKALSVQNEPKNEQIIPTFDQIEKIEKGSFVQENFTSSFTHSSMQPKQKKKKKQKQKQKQTQIEALFIETKIEPMISHENAIFGTTLDTMHVGKFSSRIDSKRKEELKTIKTDDLIFGAMFCEKPELRMKRWIEKLTLIRKRSREAEMDTTE